jgi:hypothetical protein
VVNDLREGVSDLREAQQETDRQLKAFIASLNKGSNGPVEMSRGPSARLVTTQPCTDLSALTSKGQ